MLPDPEKAVEDVAGTALAVWASRGEWARILSWLRRHLDDEGVPKRWEIGRWSEIVDQLDSLRPRRTGPWTVELQDTWASLLRAMFRFTRPDGSQVFGVGDGDEDRLATLSRWAKRASDPGLATVLRFWLGKARTHADQPPPLPAYGSGRLPLAILRADWSKLGDWAAIDGRAREDGCLVEVAANGRRLIGPGWTTLETGPNRVSRSILWKTSSMADMAEWSFRTPSGARVTRTIVLLRGRKMALLADQIDGAEGAMGLAIPPDVAVASVAESRP